jgi:hypothetical protein
MLAVSKALSRAVHLGAVGLHGLGAPGPGGQERLDDRGGGQREERADEPADRATRHRRP